MAAPSYCDTEAEDYTPPTGTNADVCAAFAFTDQTNAGLDVFYLLFAAA
eukprot:CAMPEP_0172554458 /NCGR_PEP_ID=MMETSP1067-20121228/54678_1 /TAXON_ID=265564 ORGANISM="Thalassiosira punctigera, Strain Tpunct2005C2" /NCGR_SAMPLE_ID=MMETSP1067 /ASSEMBLY_ACC=CAM_ASM_000444 /LENGTH=48 /DNA_ID= /DNA_START= /DNA_END= /DNA_ORIENTATION=